MKPISNTCEFSDLEEMLDDMLFFSNTDQMRYLGEGFRYHFEFYRFGQAHGRSNSAQDRFSP